MPTNLILPQQKLVLNAYAVLVGATPGNANLVAHQAYIAANGESAYISALNSIFASSTAAQLGATLLANLGLGTVFTQADATAYMAANATNPVGAMIALANQLANYAGTDAKVLAAQTAYNNSIDGSYNYSINTANVTSSSLSGSIVSGGQTFTLTTSIDNLTGTSGDDTFTADSGALGAADSINGGAGTDTANFFLDAADETLSASAVEVFKVQASAAGRTLNMANVTGATDVVSNASTEDLAFAAVQNAVKVTVIGGDGSDDVEVELKDDVITGTLSVELQGANIDDLAVSNDDQTQQYATVTIKGTTDNNTIDTLTDSNNTAVTALRTLNFEGDKRVTIVDELTSVTTISSANSTGGARVVIDDGATANVTFTGGAGNDRVDVQAANLTANDKLDGGAGTDTLRISDDDMLTTANAANVKNFEILEGFAAALVADATYDVDTIIANNTLTGIIVNSGAATSDITVNNINSGALGNIQILADADDVTFTAKDFVSGGTSDTATIQFGTGNVGAASVTDVDVTGPLTFNNVDVLNIKSLSDGTPAAGEQHSIANLTAPDLEKIVITGDQEFSLDIGSTELALTEVDASALTRAATIDVGDSAIVSLLLKGTAKNDVLTIDNAATGATIYTGGGSDFVTIESTSNDVFMFTATALNSGDVAAGNRVIISGVGGGETINLTSGLEALLKVASNALSAAGADVDIVAATLGSSTNIDAIVGDLAEGTVGFDLNNDGDATDTADGNDDIRLQIDLNGDGQFTATSDFEIVLVGAVDLTSVSYTAATDILTIG